MARTIIPTEADILARVIMPKSAGVSPEAALSFLTFRFDSYTQKQISQLLRKNNRGTISAEERLTLEKFTRVGQLLDLLHAKARCSLRDAGLTGSPRSPRPQR